MPHDFKFEKGSSFGEWLQGVMHEQIHFEQEASAIDRVNRVADRLQGGLPAAARLVVEIPWLDVVTAFTVPGRYIYSSRRLYERGGAARFWWTLGCAKYERTEES